MGDVNKYLLKIDNPDVFKKHVLRVFKKKKGYIEKTRHLRLAKKYDKFDTETKYLIELYVKCGMLNKEERDNKTTYNLTPKGNRALKWRVIDYFEPKWLTEDKKYAITTIIAVMALIIAIIGSGNILRGFKWVVGIIGSIIQL